MLNNIDRDKMFCVKKLSSKWRLLTQLHTVLFCLKLLSVRSFILGEITKNKEETRRWQNASEADYAREIQTKYVPAKDIFWYIDVPPLRPSYSWKQSRNINKQLKRGSFFKLFTNFIRQFHCPSLARTIVVSKTHLFQTCVHKIIN